MSEVLVEFNTVLKGKNGALRTPRACGRLDAAQLSALIVAGVRRPVAPSNGKARSADLSA